MDFQVSEEMSVRLAMIREFMDQEVIPLEGEMLHGDPQTLGEQVAVAQAKVKQLGLWAPNHPVEFGGLGLSMVSGCGVGLVFRHKFSLPLKKASLKI